MKVDLVWMISDVVREELVFNVPVPLARYHRKKRKNTTHKTGQLLLRCNKTKKILSL